MARYEVIESKAWKRDDGRTASLYGAVPWTSASEEKRWKVVTRGYTVRDNVQGTVGIGRQPWATRAEAQAWVDKENARLADIARSRGARSHSTKKSPKQLDAEIAQALKGTTFARSPHQAWDVVLDGGVIDTVFYDPDMDEDEVRRSLINHDGYDARIRVRKPRRKKVAHATVMTDAGRVLKCDMSKTCEEPVTHLDDKGFVYCTKHGVQRRGSGHRCRKLAPKELRQLQGGQPIARY